MPTGPKPQPIMSSPMRLGPLANRRPLNGSDWHGNLYKAHMDLDGGPP